MDTVAHEQRLTLITQMMCCLIAADARVSSSEIDVVHDCLVGIGLLQSHATFRDRVITACKAIHSQGAIVVARSLVEELELLRGKPLAQMLLQLQDDVIRADGRLTHAERAVANVFSSALGSVIVGISHNLDVDSERRASSLESNLVEQFSDAAVNEYFSGDDNEDDEESEFDAAQRDMSVPSVAGVEDSTKAELAQSEWPFAFLLGTRQTIDSTVGSRLIVVALIGVVAGSLGVFCGGDLLGGVAPLLFGCALSLLAVFSPSDRYLWDASYGHAERRVTDKSVDQQAASVAAGLSAPNELVFSLPVPVEVGEIDIIEADSGANAGGLETAFRLLGNRTWSFPYKSRVARRLYDLIRGQTRSGYGRSACRCTKCGRKYWFRIGSASCVICPFCGDCQHATPDWVPEKKPADDTRIRLSAWFDPPSSGPVQVRGYVNRYGTWVASHSRTRPSRRRW